MTMIAERKSHDWTLIGILYILFPIFGLFDGIRGTLAVTIKDYFGVNYTAVGMMMTIGTLGWSAGCFLSGLLAERKGQRRVISFGVFTSSIGLIVLRFANSFIGVCILFFTILFSFGCFEIGSSIITRLNIKHVPVLLSLFIFSYSAGNILGPFYASRLISAGQTWQQVISYLAIPLAACLILILISSKRRSAFRPPVEPVKMNWNVFRSKFLWLLMILVGLAVSIEFNMVNWLVIYLEDVAGYTFLRSSNLLSYYFIVFAAGRFFGGYIIHKIGWRRTLIIMSTLMLALFVPGVILGQAGVWLFLGFGFCTSVVFPTILIAVSGIFKQNITPIMGIVIASSGCINLVFSYLIGLVCDLLGVIYGFSIIAFCSLLIIIIAQIVVRLKSIRHDDMIDI